MRTGIATFAIAHILENFWQFVYIKQVQDILNGTRTIIYTHVITCQR